MRLLFVCIRNSCRSPMAQGFATQLGDGDVVAESAGTQPRRRVDPLAAHVMRVQGTRIDHRRTRALDGAIAQWADHIVVLAGELEALGPLPFPEKTEWWRIEDPLGWPLDVYEDARDEIRTRVAHLLEACAPRVFRGALRGPATVLPDHALEASSSES